MDEIVDGGELSWHLALEADLMALGFASVGDTIFLMATSSRDGGLWIWSTVDALTWRDHGEVVPAGDMIGAVGSTGRELLAVTAPNAGLKPQVLWSRDGDTWDRDHIPSDPGKNPLLAFRPSVIGGSEDLTLVAGSTVLDPRALILEKFGDALPADIDRALLGAWWDRSGGDLLLGVTVPPGFTIAEATADELGLTAQERSWLIEGDTSSGVSLWIQSPGGGWAPGLFRDANFATSIFNAPDGEVLLTTSGAGSASVFGSFSGVDWELLTSVERPLTASVWGDVRIGPSATGGDSDVLVSRNGHDWTRTNLSIRFPVAPVFTVTHTAADRGGYLATVESFDWTYREPPSEGLGFSTVDRDGLTVRISDLTFGPSGLLDGPHQVAVYEHGAAEPYVYPISGPPQRDDLSIDLAAQNITFRDSDGANLITVTFEAMDDLLYRIATPARQFTRAHSQALAHTTDAKAWNLWDLSELVGGNAIADAGLAANRALVAVDTRDGGLEVWEATLP